MSLAKQGGLPRDQRGAGGQERRRPRRLLLRLRRGRPQALRPDLAQGRTTEVSPTTEDYASELLREAAGQTVYLESLSGK
jgi:hypothetical protein